MQLFNKTIILFLIVFVGGCVTTRRIQKTSLDLQAFQLKEVETTKKIAFASVLSVFQDLGYIVDSADLDTGFITARSPANSGFVPFIGMVTKDTMATAFIEEFHSNIVKIRLNFVEEQESSGGYGMKSKKGKPIEDPLVYQNAFSRIQEAIFIRSATKNNINSIQPAPMPEIINEEPDEKIMESPIPRSQTQIKFDKKKFTDYYMKHST